MIFLHCTSIASDYLMWWLSYVEMTYMLIMVVPYAFYTIVQDVSQNFHVSWFSTKNVLLSMAFAAYTYFFNFYTMYRFRKLSWFLLLQAWVDYSSSLSYVLMEPVMTRDHTLEEMTLSNRNTAYSTSRRSCTSTLTSFIA